MNKNIEVINENLWAVNQQYVKQGYIKELTTLPGAAPETQDASLTDDGIIVLNKCSPVYGVLKKFVPRIMAYSDEQLNSAREKMQKVSEPDAYEKMYLSVLEWEIKRRCVKAEYLSSQPKPTFKDKIVKWMIRKKVRKWHLFKQQ